MDGILNVYKEKGYTSHDVVARLRGITGEQHIGHTGTLDPAAVGVLPICLGMSTKICDILTDRSKTYETVLLLGIETETDDTTGKMVSRGDVNDISAEKLKSVIAEFTGEIEQVPPMYSAVKVEGQKLYDLARQGISVERKSRKVRINSIDILSDIQFGTLKERKLDFGSSLFNRFNDDEFSENGRWQWDDGSVIESGNEELKVCRVVLRIDCDKGTYIRSLCSDIGKKLGCGGCMERLLRVRVGEFDIEGSLKLKQIEDCFKKYKFEGEPLPVGLLIPTDRCFMEYPSLRCKEKYEQVLLNGNIMKLKHFAEYIVTPDPVVRVYDSKKNFIALYEWLEDKKFYKPLKMFRQTN